MKEECICPIQTCLKEFNSANNLDLHLQRLHPETSTVQVKEEEPENHSVLSEESDNFTIIPHEIVDLSSEESDDSKSKSFECKFCHIKFSDRNQCEMHQLIVHQKGKKKTSELKRKISNSSKYHGNIT